MSAVSACTPSKVTPCLWFNFNAEEAVNFYTGLFKNSRILEVSRYGDAMPAHKGKMLLMRFELDGREFQALNAGPQFPFTEAMSLSVDCADQAEVDMLWSKLTEGGGKPGQCGWLKDRFGLSWQIVPRVMVAFLQSPDTRKAARVMQAMMTMGKLDVARLQQAHDQA